MGTRAARALLVCAVWVAGCGGGGSDEQRPAGGMDAFSGEGGEDAFFDLDAVAEAADATPPDAARDAVLRDMALSVDAAPDAGCQPAPEVCDGVDDDCDGRVDRDDHGPLTQRCFDGPAERVGVGACRAGIARCVRGAFGACGGEVVPSDEVCDRVDNDCDGTADEGPDGGPLVAPCYDGPPMTAGVGRCAAGTRACAGGLLGACTGEVVPAVEICDGEDDDCDGRVDEGLDCACVPGTDQPCYAGPPGTDGAGPCHAGHQVCRADGSGFEACEQQVLPAVEACNGVDDDCDGAVDDAAGAGMPCTAGTGACAAQGMVACDAAGMRCDAVPGAPAAEACNGADDDCDGRTDEDFDLGAVCSAGTGACAASGQRVCDAAGGVACSAVPGPPRDEACNGVDDDCDGTVDEELGLGEACVAGVGACAAMGARVCAPDGAAICDAVPGAPGVEACNGADDDCDGTADEDTDRACYDGPAGTAGVGRCAAGVQACRDGALGACAGEVLPADETCDGSDEDCDGAVDEDAVRACYDGPEGTAGVGACRAGTVACAGGACAGEVVPAAEACNGADDDCDGTADEGLVQACYDGPPGTAGVGICHAGRQTCADGRFGACEAQQLPGVEVCNGEDDDCDGAVDEDTDRPCYGGPAGTAGVGACRAGVEACAGGVYTGVCENEVRPAAESCDGTDQDCDGTADDGFDLGRACTAGTGACARDGVRVCDGAGGATCSATAGAPGVEACNGADDDCDGATDEDTDRPCYDGPPGTSGVGTCHGGTEACLNGAYTGVCEGEVQPAVETCDGADQDCDGTADDGFDLGQACTVGQGACARTGVRVCDGAGGARCSVAAGSPGAEICGNQRDDDCDGTVDEGAGCIGLSAGNAHTCARLPGGRVECWGFNGGRLGLGDANNRGDDPDEMGANLPAVDLGRGHTATAVFAFDAHSCAVLENGALKCWGFNNHGQLGLGDTATRGDNPDEMGDALPGVDLGSGRTAIDVVGGSNHTCALLDDGTVKCWGYDNFGQLGQGDTVDRGDGPGEMGDALPAVALGTGRRATAIAGGATHVCALLDDGTVKCWGHNNLGQLGQGDTVDRGDGPGEMGDALPAVALGTGRTAVALAAGNDHTCALLDDGTTKCWGRGGTGALGRGPMGNVGAAPGTMGDALRVVDLGTGHRAVALSMGQLFSCALLEDASVKCWGYDDADQLGLGDTATRGDNFGEMGDALPAVDLGAGRSVVAFDAGGEHVCAVLDNGVVKCWGGNFAGQLGQGDTVNRGDDPAEMGDALPAVPLQ